MKLPIVPTVLSNGAVLRLIARQCEVCTGRNEISSNATYEIEYQGQKVPVCDAHAQKLLEMDEEQRGGFEKFVGMR